MKVSEAIDQLKIGDTVWVKGKAEYIGKSGALPLALEFAEMTKYFVEADEISLTEPKNEKVEVPDFVAPFIEKLKTTGRRYGFELEKAYASGEDADLSEWLGFNKNVLIVFKALENGYTVKPKRWVVKIGDYHSTYIESLTIIPKLRYTLSEQEGAYKFTNHERAEAVATLVEGSVEEI